MKNTQNTPFQTIKKVTIVNALTNLLLAVVKILVGWAGHSHALIADGIHSFSDLISDLLVFMAAKVGGQQPDDDHPYGHRRIETVGAIIVAVLLLAVGIYIVYDASHHFMTHTARELPSSYVVVTAFFSILINEGLYRYGKYFGLKINSPLLISNAWHNRSDAFVSLIVVITVGASILGVKHLDIMGAFIIGLMIIYAGAKMLYTCFSELVDTAVPEQTTEEMKNVINKIPGVVALHQLRTRSLGGDIFADVHIQVDPRISVSEGHYIGEHVHLSLIKDIKHMRDVTVHVDPEDDETNQPCEHLPNRPTIESTLQAAWIRLPDHEKINHITIHYHDGHIDVDVLFEHGDIDHNLTSCYQDAAKASLSCIQTVRLYHKL
jgi:cation diffusion facilitator family transporter